MAEHGFIVTIPHSGENFPVEAQWMQNLDHLVALRDVDRFVDQLYRPILEQLKIPFVDTQWSRYVVDLNRDETEFDADSVEGAPQPSGTFPRGLHWSITTYKEKILERPMTQETHRQLMDLCFYPFHNEILRKVSRLKQSGHDLIFHLDLHSMPSMGTSEHKDPGQRRADIVISDFNGRSAAPEFLELVVEGYAKQGFTTRVNWPYIGGGVTQRYGKPNEGHHTIQVELNRGTYMNESTKEKLESFTVTQAKLAEAIAFIAQKVRTLKV